MLLANQNRDSIIIVIIILFPFSLLVCIRSINPSNVTEGVKYPDVSTYNGSVFTPWQGALQIYNASDKSSWCANDNDSNKNHFLQLDFKLVKVIQTVAIQAHSTEDKWVKSLTISSSLDGIFWNQYKEAGILKVIHILI